MKWTYNQETGEELTPLEKILNKELSCGNSGTKYTDDHGHSVGVWYACRTITCKKCLPHRVNNIKQKFAWMNSPEYVFKIVFGIKNTTSELLHINRNHHHDIFDIIRKQYPNKWFRLLFTNQHFIILTKSNDKDFEGWTETTFEQTMKEYEDWTNVIEESAKETLLIEFKGRRRILGHGKTPVQNPKACNLSINGYSVKRTGGEVVTKEEMEDLESGEQVPIEKLKYNVDGENGKTKTLTFKEFVTARISGLYETEWEEYHGVLESTRMQKYLAYLKKNDSKTWGFIK